MSENINNGPLFPVDGQYGPFDYPYNQPTEIPYSSSEVPYLPYGHNYYPPQAQADYGNCLQSEYCQQDGEPVVNTNVYDYFNPYPYAVPPPIVAPQQRERIPTRSPHRSGRLRNRSNSRSSSTSFKYDRKFRSQNQRTNRSKSRTAASTYRRRSRSQSKSPLAVHRKRSRSKSRKSRSTSRTSRSRRRRSRSKSRTTVSHRRSRSTSRTSRSRRRSRSKSRTAVSHRRSRSTSRNRRRRSRSKSRTTVSHRRSQSKDDQRVRRFVIDKWRLNNCQSANEMEERLNELSKMNPEEILEAEKKIWSRSTPTENYYKKAENNTNETVGTKKLEALCDKFEYELVERGPRVRAGQPHYVKPPKKFTHKPRHHHHHQNDESCSSESDIEISSNFIFDESREEMEIRKQHPFRLHRELWFNDRGELNDGPLCRCSNMARKSGIRHGIYAGETGNFKCNPNSNNLDKLYHYRVTISPPTNFLTRTPTIIEHDAHEFIFEGFSILSHYPLGELPVCKVIRFNIEYMILYIEETAPDNFTIRELDLFFKFFFLEILELVDFDLMAHGDKSGCPQFHFMPRFVRELPDNGRELLSMNYVLQFLLNSNKALIDKSMFDIIDNMSTSKWQDFVDDVKGMVVTYPGMKPCSLRVDQLDRDAEDESKKESSVKGEAKRSIPYPEIVHFGIRPPQLSYAGNPEYQKAWRSYVKLRHLVYNMAKPTDDDKRKLAEKDYKLQVMRTSCKMKRDITVTVSSEGFYRTGLMCDVSQHAMLLPVLVCHLRFHRSLDVLEKKIEYTFKNRFLLQIAMTHPSYRENFGTNPAHARNSLSNCGIRQPKYGDRRIHYMSTRKRGLNTLINIMARFGKGQETVSDIYHNERLEFLGDAVVEFITTTHLYSMFPDVEEGGLATYRAAVVQNQHLTELAKKLGLHEFMLYAHGSDLCHDVELKHAMANCFEALMGALFLDGGIEPSDSVFGKTLFQNEPELISIWFQNDAHPLQDQEPQGDRKFIEYHPFLQRLTEFEDMTGYEFKHIRLLARAFTDRSIGYTNLTMGSNQRMEFLGDSVLQLIASDYLYKHFPEHHEGHLSLLRSSLVNNKTQSIVCDDLGMVPFAQYANPKSDLKVKDKADLVEAYLGALYVDSDFDTCKLFCDVCFFPRLRSFILNQDWNDPKSKLQQCCLTLRTMDGGEPDIPIYKVIECTGPTNTRAYTVAVYFRAKRLASATGHSIQQAEMNAAKEALERSGELFPQLDHQKRVIEKSLKVKKNNV